MGISMGGRSISTAAIAMLAFLSHGQLAWGGGDGSQIFFIPQFGHGTSENRRFESTMSILSLSTTPGQVLVQSFSDSGLLENLLEQAGESVFETTREIPVLGAADVFSLNELPGQELITGWLRVQSTQKVGLEVTFKIFDEDGKLVTSVDIRPAEFLTAAAFRGIVGNGIDTGVALLNAPGENNSPAEITLEAIDRNGNSQANGKVMLQTGEKKAVFISQIFQGLSNFDGSIELKSRVLNTQNPLPIAILPLRQQGLILTSQSTFPPRRP